MSIHSVANDSHLIRSELWSSQLKTLLLDDLFAMKFVRVLTEFPDGTTFTIPSLGEAVVRDFSEGQTIQYDRLDTGEFQFSFDKYQYAAHAITDKFKRDSYYAQDVISAFVPRQHRALMEAVETRIFERMNAGQTASAVNAINNADHRWVGSGTSETISPVDFFKARYALRKANVPLANLVAVMDPSTVYALETQANIVNMLSPHASSESIVREGLSTGMRFRYNFAGFDVYESNYLPSSISETVDGRTVTTGVANMFFSAAGGDIAPIVGGFRQMPTVESYRNIDLQQEQYVTIAEYGFKLYRPENLVVVLTDTDQV